MMVYKLIMAGVVLVTCISCERKPYVNHKLQFEKAADNCKDQQNYFRMTSNMGGERYEFEKCLPVDFTKEQVLSERKGDTVFVQFPGLLEGTESKVFDITLDIDSYPRYHFLTIDNNTVTITPSEN